MIRKVDRPRQCLEDIREFADSGWDCAEVDTTPYNMRSVYSTYYHALQRYRDEFPEVRVMARGCKVYLVRVES